MRTSTRAALVLALLVLGVPGALYAFPDLAGSDDAFVVLSGSMEPSFSPGDVVFVDRTPFDDLRVGDVVTFALSPGGRTLVTHRVVALDESETGPVLRTKGDANEDVDPFVVTPETYVGRYEFHVPWWGHLARALHTMAGYVLLVLVPGAAVLAWSFADIYRQLAATDRRGAPP